MNNKLKVTIVDYNLGNTFSVANAIKYLGYKVEVSAEFEKIQNADVLILPGVGAFEEAIKNIKVNDLDKVLTEHVIVNQKPILGICVGMQLLANFSEENGIHRGLGWIEGSVKKIIPTNLDEIPHVGWNNVIYNEDSILYSRLGHTNNFYFDHSYHFECAPSLRSSICQYAGKEITSSVQKDNIFGVQFHPEKSQNAGLKLFRGFLESI